MKIIVADGFVPFTADEAGSRVDHLAEALRRHGHTVEVVRIPFVPRPTALFEQLLAVRLLELRASAELLIALHAPSHALRHPHKLVWSHRPLLDSWGTLETEVAETPEARKTSAVIREAETRFLREGRRVYAMSETAAARLWCWNRIRADVVYPPVGNPERYRCGEFADYVFCPGSIGLASRPGLAVEGLKCARSPLRLVLAGPAETSSTLERLWVLVKRHGLEGRVRVIDRRLSEAERLDLLANATGCLSVAKGGESAMTTVESFQAQKPVITCMDSGAPLELVENGRSGFVVPPIASALGEALDRLMEKPDTARAMGRAGSERIASMDLSWDRVVTAFVP